MDTADYPHDALGKLLCPPDPPLQLYRENNQWHITTAVTIITIRPDWAHSFVYHWSKWSVCGLVIWRYGKQEPLASASVKGRLSQKLTTVPLSDKNDTTDRLTH